ncbi:MAG: inner membrane protein YnbA [Verrucomicrobiota bacterium]|jgi:CDP-diacylglycerol--glycerol-3-phosphate 3-phosphatidyltransferase
MVFGMREAGTEVQSHGEGRRRISSIAVPSIYELKPRFQQLLRPCVGRLARFGVTANQVTLAAMLMSLAVGGVVAMWPGRVWLLLLMPVTLFVRMALNAVDGMLAREHGMQSRLGAVLNELGDVISDVALYLPLARFAGVDAGWVVVVVLLGVLAEMAGVVALQVGSARRYEGPMGKSDRAFVMGLLACLLGCGVVGGAWVTAYLVVVSGLALWTVVRRCRAALNEGGAR